MAKSENNIIRKKEGAGKKAWVCINLKDHFAVSAPAFESQYLSDALNKQ